MDELEALSHQQHHVPVSELASYFQNLKSLDIFVADGKMLRPCLQYCIVTKTLSQS